MNYREPRSRWIWELVSWEALWIRSAHKFSKASSIPEFWIFSKSLHTIKWSIQMNLKICKLGSIVNLTRRSNTSILRNVSNWDFRKLTYYWIQNSHWVCELPNEWWQMESKSPFSRDNADGKSRLSKFENFYFEWVMSLIIESCHIWMSHITYEWVDVTYNWVTSHMNESHHIRMSLVT